MEDRLSCRVPGLKLKMRLVYWRMEELSRLSGVMTPILINMKKSVEASKFENGSEPACPLGSQEK